MKIYTITVNPVYDRHFYAESFRTDIQNYADTSFVEAGGKGINVSRALSAFGKDNTALVILGTKNCEEFEQKLKGTVNYLPIYADTEIRENLIIHTPKSETRLCYDKTLLPRGILEQLKKNINEPNNSIVIFSGRLAKGIEKEEAIKFLCSLKDAGALLFIDSNSFTLEDLKKIKPFFIKPNEQELSEWTGNAQLSEDVMRKQAVMLSGSVAECVLLSLGEHGAYFSKDGKLYKATVPKISPLSTVGAGDSSVAGFAYAYSNGASVEQSIRCAVAFGTSACLTVGTQPPRKEDYEDIYSKTQVNLYAASL